MSYCNSFYLTGSIDQVVDAVDELFQTQRVSAGR